MDINLLLTIDKDPFEHKNKAKTIIQNPDNGPPSTMPSLQDSTSEGQGFTLLALEENAVFICMAKLQNAALRRLRFAANEKVQTNEDVKKIGSERLVNWISMLGGEDVRELSGGMLGADDMPFLSDRELLQHEELIHLGNWPFFASLLVLPCNGTERNNWNCIFEYVVGETIEKTASIHRTSEQVLAARSRLVREDELDREYVIVESFD